MHVQGGYALRVTEGQIHDITGISDDRMLRTLRSEKVADLAFDKTVPGVRRHRASNTRSRNPARGSECYHEQWEQGGSLNYLDPVKRSHATVV